MEGVQEIDGIKEMDEIDATDKIENIWTLRSNTRQGTTKSNKDHIRNQWGPIGKLTIRRFDLIVKQGI